MSIGNFVRRTGSIGLAVICLGLSGGALATAPVGVAAGAPAAAPACTERWTGAAGGSFVVATNWTPNAIPGASDTICSAKGSSIVSSGNVTVTSAQLAGSLTISGGTFDMTDTTDTNSIAKLILSGGTQSGNLTVTSTLSWTGGDFGGSGTTTLSSAVKTTAAFTAGWGFITGSHVLHNSGTINEPVTTKFCIAVDPSSSFLNYGTFSATGIGSVVTWDNSYPGQTVVNESGATWKVAPGVSGTANISIPFTNLGTVDLVNGTLELDSTNVTSVPSDTGTYSGGSGTVLDLANSRSFASTASLAVGTVEMNSQIGVDTFAGNSVANLALLGGTQSGNLTITSTLSWTGGTFGGSGTTTLPSGSTTTAAFTAGWGFITNGHVLHNSGTINEPVTTKFCIAVDPSSSFLNYGTFSATGTGSVVTWDNSYPGQTVVNESGATWKVAPGVSGTANIVTPFTNLGTLDVLSGTLSISTFTNNGDIALGLQDLQVSGTFTESSKSVLEVSLASAGHGSVQVSGNTALGGQLALTTVSGYTPAVGSAASLLTTSVTQTGKFKSITGQVIGTSDTGWKVTTASKDVALTVKPLADVSAAVTAPGTAVVGVSFSVGLTITDNGPKSATGSTLSLTVPTGATVTGTLPAGCAQPSAKLVKCSAGTLASGASTNFSIPLVSSTPGVAVFSVRAATSATDTVTTNNAASTTVNII